MAEPFKRGDFVKHKISGERYAFDHVDLGYAVVSDGSGATKKIPVSALLPDDAEAHQDRLAVLEQTVADLAKRVADLEAR